MSELLGFLFDATIVGGNIGLLVFLVFMILLTIGWFVGGYIIMGVIFTLADLFLAAILIINLVKEKKND